MADYEDKLLDHEYDGIRELDNSLPRWWVYLFIVTIIWSVFYMVFYHIFGIGYTQREEYLKEINPQYVRISASGSRLLGVLPEYRSPFFNPAGDITPRSKIGGRREAVPFITAESDSTIYIAVTDPAEIENGRKLFLKNCSPCHGKLGEGGVGPNLADNYWLHGAEFSSIVKSVKYGYPAKGMIPWRGTLNEQEIIRTSSYVTTLLGSDPPNPRSPQGDLVTE